MKTLPDFIKSSQDLNNKELKATINNTVKKTCLELSLVYISEILDIPYVDSFYIIKPKYSFYVFYPALSHTISSTNTQHSKSVITKNKLDQVASLRQYGDYVVIPIFEDEFLNIEKKQQIKILESIATKIKQSQIALSSFGKKKFEKDSNQFFNLFDKKDSLHFSDKNEFVNYFLINDWGKVRKTLILAEDIEKNISANKPSPKLSKKL